MAKRSGSSEELESETESEREAAIRRFNKEIFHDLDVDKIEADADESIPEILPNAEVLDLEEDNSNSNSPELIVDEPDSPPNDKRDHMSYVLQKLLKIDTIFSDLECILFEKRTVLDNTYLRIHDKKLTHDQRHVMNLKYQNAINFKDSVVNEFSLLKSEHAKILKCRSSVINNPDIAVKIEMCNQVIRALGDILMKTQHYNTKINIRANIKKLLEKLEDARNKLQR